MSNILSTARLSIRPIVDSDGPAIFQLYCNGTVCQYLDIDPYSIEQEAQAHVQSWITASTQRKQFRYAICLGSNLIGSCGIYSIYWHQQRASLGYELHPAFWNHGYMYEALAAFIPWCKEYHQLQRLQATVLPDNQASIRLLNKLGFDFEGVLRRYEKWAAKGFVDLAIYACL